MVKDIQLKLKDIESREEITEFLNGFFLSYNIPRATLIRLGLNKAVKADGEIVIGNRMFCVYTKAANLYARYDQIQRKLVKNNKYRFVMLINDNDILALDTNSSEWLYTERCKIHSDFEFFLPLAGIERSITREKKNASTKVGERFAQLFNEILMLNHGKEKEGGILLINLVAALFSDSCGILNPGTIYHLVELYSKKDGSDLDELLIKIFDLIAGRDEELSDGMIKMRCKTLNDVPQYFGSLRFDTKSRKTVLSLCELNWDAVEPEVIGALLQEILNPEDAEIAYNYTSTANIYKVIGPLFLDDLYEEYEKQKKEKTLSTAFLSRLEKINVFDPACGTGNFLMVCFREIKKLELLVKKYCDEMAIPFDDKEYVTLDNFYGIEKNYIATEVCRIGLAFTERKLNNCTNTNISLPINTICNGRSLLMDWEAFCPKSGVTYIVGNPSYKGAHSLGEKQQEVRVAFAEEIANGFKTGELDYAASYFYKATRYIQGTQNAFAFVTTNSLTQGIHVPSLWPILFSKGIEISFAHTSFKWKNEGRNTTAVTVVIIGCRTKDNPHNKTIYDKNFSYDADSISPYLTKGGIIVEKENKGPICKNLPKMIKGNMPYNTEYLLLNSKEKQSIVEAYPESTKFFMRVVGTDEFIYAKERWCLWIHDELLEDAMKIPPIAERIEKVKEARLASKDKAVKRMATRAHQFREMNMPDHYSLVVPSVTLEKRPYLQIGYLGIKYVVTNLAFVIYDAEPWVFGLIASKMHNLWIKTICGGLETRIRYSNVLGYNTFPVPQLNEEQKATISEAALGVILERERNSEKNLVELYNDETMPEGLRYAHKILDEVIERCYKPEGFFSDQERLDEMFMLYRSIKEAN